MNYLFQRHQKFLSDYYLKALVVGQSMYIPCGRRLRSSALTVSVSYYLTGKKMKYSNKKHIVEFFEKILGRKRREISRSSDAS